ncbi:hypothetical protein GF324_00820 [bacterium]|nr:hypothetical protein [bacterium]
MLRLPGGGLDGTYCSRRSLDELAGEADSRFGGFGGGGEYVFLLLDELERETGCDFGGDFGVDFVFETDCFGSLFFELLLLLFFLPLSPAYAYSTANGVNANVRQIPPAISRRIRERYERLGEVFISTPSGCGAGRLQAVSL